MSDVNMLTSLKALLFSSAAAPMPADGAAASATPVEGAADFASLLNGTMDASQEAQENAGVGGSPQIDPTTTPVKAGKADETLSSLPFGLANALRAVQSHRKDSLPLPPGLAAKIDPPAQPGVDQASVDQASVGGTVPAHIESSVEEVAAQEPEPVPVASEEVETDAPELPVVTPDKHAKATRPGKEAKPGKVEAQPETAAVEHSDDLAPAEQGDTDKPKEQADAAPASATVVATVQTFGPQGVPVQVLPTSAPVVTETVPVRPDGGKNLPAAAPLPPSFAGQAVEATHVANGSVQPAMAAPAASDEQAEGPVPAAHPPIRPDSAPAKSEALALLQMVRDQVAARQPGTPVRAGEALAARARTGGAAAPVETSPANAVQPNPLDAAPQMPVVQPAAVPSIQPPVAAAPADLSASLGAQVVDMGVSGQWIDGLAREIAGLSANGAQGRFQINADQLGPVQVDIRQGSDGAAVSLTVASEAAEMALRQDSDRLRLDAGLSAVRIAEVKIDRMPHVAEAARSDGASQQQSSQQQGSQGASGWANNSQNMAQSQGQTQGQGRWRAQENNAFAPKNSGDPAVLNHDELRRAGNSAARARYA